MDTTAPPQKKTRWREAINLTRLALLFVAAAAGMGWAASFVGLHDFAVKDMAGFDQNTGWFVPGAFDGAAFGCSLITYRASVKGRVAVVGRLLMWAFTAVSAAINYLHQVDSTAKWVACGLPAAAVAVFDVVLIELRADYEEKHGRQAFRLRLGLLFLRWLVDRKGTRGEFQKQIKAIPVSSLAGLGAQLLAEQASEPKQENRSAPKPAAERAKPVPAIEAPANDAKVLDLVKANSLAEQAVEKWLANPNMPFSQIDREIGAVNGKGEPTRTTSKAVNAFVKREGHASPEDYLRARVQAG